MGLSDLLARVSGPGDYEVTYYYNYDRQTRYCITIYARDSMDADSKVRGELGSNITILSTRKVGS